MIYAVVPTNGWRARSSPSCGSLPSGRRNEASKAHANTDGDAFVYFEKANVLHTGDVMMSIGYPVVDVGNGGSLAGLMSAQEEGPERLQRPDPSNPRPWTELNRKPGPR